MTDRVIDILQLDLNNETILWLQHNDDFDEHLNEAITAYEISLESMGVEIFNRGFTYLVAENCVYLASYEDDTEELTEY